MRYDNHHYGPIDRFCAKHPRFGIPNLMRVIMIIQVAVYILDLFLHGALTNYFMPFIRELILQGQLWRLVTFVFIPEESNPIYLALMCYFYHWIGQTLEQVWGTARFNLFYLSGVVLSAIFGMIFGYASIYYVNLSIFLIIATLFGEQQVLYFFVVPIKMKWLALLDVALVVMGVAGSVAMGNWIMALLPVASFINYFIFTWPFWSYKLGIVKRKTDPKVIHFKKVQREAEKKAQGQSYRHKCAVCGITDADDPDMEFRYCSRCDGYFCYCMNHINNHVHVHKD